MERQRIRDQISTLEEQIELLREISFSNGKFPISPGAHYDFSEEAVAGNIGDCLRELQNLVAEQNLEKSLPAQEFLRRVVSVLVREASASGQDISISTFGSGRISLEMVEISMGAIMACLRASLKSFKGMSHAQRSKLQLFNTCSIYLELRAAPEEVQFRITDDGRGYAGNFRLEFESEKHFHKIRSHIARFGGWFRRQSLPEYGGTIEFKVPLAASRSECVVVRARGCEILIPSACVAEIRQGGIPAASGEGIPVAVLDEVSGLLPAPAGEEWPSVIRVAVADFQFWVRCETTGLKVKARKYAAEGLVEPESWLRNFGIFHDQGLAKVLPILEGPAMMEFFLQNEGAE